MDTYLRGLVQKYKDLWSPPSSIDEDILERCAPSDTKAHWFENCRMFHKEPCEMCEYRFECYTT